MSLKYEPMVWLVSGGGHVSALEEVKVPNHLPWSRRGHLLSSHSFSFRSIAESVLYLRACKPSDKGGYAISGISPRLQVAFQRGLGMKNLRDWKVFDDTRGRARPNDLADPARVVVVLHNAPFAHLRCGDSPDFIPPERTADALS